MPDFNKLCIIPARGGSKRIRRKNLVRIAGKPLVNYSVDLALASGLFNEVIVSSEDKEIQSVISRGARIYDRPQNLAMDNVRLTEVCRNLLNELQKGGERFDVFCLLQPAAPLRTLDDLKKSYELLTPGVNYVVSVSEFDDPPFWALHEDEKGYLRLYFGDKYLKPRQQLPQIYRHNGSIVWARTEVFQKEGEYLGCEKTVGFKMPLERSLEADYPHQLQLIQTIIERESNHERT
jgi:CMP-N-acetylneuraminic acid synthetase